jgi:hypothetical protein
MEVVLTKQPCLGLIKKSMTCLMKNLSQPSIELFCPEFEGRINLFGLWIRKGISLVESFKTTEMKMLVSIGKNCGSLSSMLGTKYWYGGLPQGFSLQDLQWLVDWDQVTLDALYVMRVRSPSNIYFSFAPYPEQSGLALAGPSSQALSSPLLAKTF